MNFPVLSTKDLETVTAPAAVSTLSSKGGRLSGKEPRTRGGWLVFPNPTQLVQDAQKPSGRLCHFRMTRSTTGKGSLWSKTGSWGTGQENKAGKLGHAPRWPRDSHGHAPRPPLGAGGACDSLPASRLGQRRDSAERVKAPNRLLRVNQGRPSCWT